VGLLWHSGLFKERIETHLDKQFLAVREQSRADQADGDEYVDKNVYSCGSLAPKLSRGGCGCSDIGNMRRTKKPWEITEGLIYLLKEISIKD